jgi:mycofactocin biosynthetic radical S-adenosylmethionine protein MftC
MSSTSSSAQLTLVPQYFGSIVYDRNTSQYMPFDAEATKLLMQLKSRSIEEILQQELEATEARRVVGFFEHFYQVGFFSIDRKFIGKILNVKPTERHLTGPLALHLEVCDSCNIECKHCFAGQLPRLEKALVRDELDRLFTDMASMGTFRLGLTGGEPLLRPDLLDIIDLATEHGLSPCLTTNGLLITEDYARELGKRKLAWLNVSIEGASAHTHDYIRGDGTFEKLLQRLSILSKYTKFSLAFTLMRSNSDEARACAELAYRVGAQAAVFRPLYPVGTALNHPELMPTLEEYIRALEGLSGKMDSTLELCNVHPWGPETRSNFQSTVYENFGCGAGNTVCSVSVSGDVSPCSFLGSSFVAGNLREIPFDQIWHHSRIFTEIRSLPGNAKCLNCSMYNTCSGGCRARALVSNGSINAADPWCASQLNFEN